MTACTSERRLLQLYKAEPLDTSPADSPVDGTIDHVSEEILRRFHGAMLEQFEPRGVAGDGNCFYRASSLALYGSQEYHIYLRICTASEILTHRDVYDVNSATALSEIVESLPSSSVDSLLTDALTPGAYAELAHLYALSAALSVVFTSYMPMSSAITTFNPYTRNVVGRGVRPTGATRYTVMWTSTTIPARMRDFQPNHFVFMAPRTVVTESVDAVAVDDDVIVSESLHVDFEADSAAFASADKSMDQTDRDATTVSD